MSQVIHLSDSVRVLDVVVDGRPRETGTFLVETTEKEYVFASDRAHLADWTLQLSNNRHKHTHETGRTVCLQSFVHTVSWTLRPVLKLLLDFILLSM